MHRRLTRRSWKRNRVSAGPKKASTLDERVHTNDLQEPDFRRLQLPRRYDDNWWRDLSPGGAEGAVEVWAGRWRRERAALVEVDGFQAGEGDVVLIDEQVCR